ncbi:glycosyltransferase WbsX family protein, partial [Sulfitobacter donghicola]
GKGFTEWRGVVAAQSMFDGHNQPLLPTDLGFYDLRATEVMGEQAALAQAHGVDAFCVYHYWFDGRRVLEAPLDKLLERPEINFPFYLCWANESWRRNWDGLSGTVLLEQTYKRGFEQKLVDDSLKYMRDPRYIRPDGVRPRFVIYRPEDMPDPAASVAKMRRAWAAAGIGDVELGAVCFHVGGDAPVADDLFDFWVEMPPHGIVTMDDYVFGGPEGNKLGRDVRTGFKGLVYDYNKVIKNSVSKEYVNGLPDNTICGVMPSWDNSARRGYKAHMAYGANPARFGVWLDEVKRHRISGSYRKELFVNAWNEWAEKAVIEPNSAYGDMALRMLEEKVGKENNDV